MYNTILHALKKRSWLRIILLFYIYVLILIYFLYVSRAQDAHWIARIVKSKDRNATMNYEEPTDFPIAFSVLVYTDLPYAYRLIQAIYRKQNYYCIHIDKKVHSKLAKGLRRLLQRYGSNVIFIPKKERVNVKWGHISVLRAELKCCEQLLKMSKNWKYWINLTGQEFPLRTNWELIEACRAINGSNMVDAMFFKKRLNRFPTRHLKAYNVTWYKGSTHIVVRREFVEFMLVDNRAIRIMKVLEIYGTIRRYPIIPDETYYSTLNHNPTILPVPGAYVGQHNRSVIYPTRYKIWEEGNVVCKSGAWLRSICMLGTGEFPDLIKSPQFFANKFLPSVQPAAYTKLETWIKNKENYERRYGRLHPSFNLSYYQNLPFYEKPSLD